MNAIIKWFVIIVALTFWGVFATFLVLLNKVKDEEEKKENENGKTCE